MRVYVYSRPGQALRPFSLSGIVHCELNSPPLPFSTNLNDTGSVNNLKRPTQARSGFGLLEWAGVVPQGLLVTTAKQSWNAGWMTLMKELAPQNEDGQYVRPSYAFKYNIENSPSARF